MARIDISALAIVTESEAADLTEKAGRVLKAKKKQHRSGKYAKHAKVFYFLVDAPPHRLNSIRTEEIQRRLKASEIVVLCAHAGHRGDCGEKVRYFTRDAGRIRTPKPAAYGCSAGGRRPDASIDDAERLLLEEIARLRSEPVTEAELDKAKRGLEVGLLDGLDRSHALAMRIAGETVTLGRIRSLEERLEAIRSVTIADVQRVAKRYLRDDGRSVVRVVAPDEASSP